MQSIIANLFMIFAAAESVPLMIIMFDGCRWDYIHNSTMEGWNYVKSVSSSAKYMLPVYPADSYPNWQAISTGLYPENHGIPMNYMYNEEKESYFLQHPHPNVSQSHWWAESEPLWITAEKNNKKTMLHGWGGCEVEINGVKPTFCAQYTSYRDLDEYVKTMHYSMNKVFDQLKNNKIDLGMVYVELLDVTAHRHGLKSSQFDRALRKVDNAVKKLTEKIQRSNEVNVIMLSDHGMSPSLSEDVVYINTTELLSSDDIFKVLGHGSTQLIYTKRNIDETYFILKNNLLQGVNVYRKKDIPESFHLKNSKRLPHILLAADPGYYILPLCNDLQLPIPCEKLLNGTHGYDPEVDVNMRGIFLGLGPAFKKNHSVPFVQSVDGYGLMCHLLGIEPNANNGSWSRVQEMLDQNYARDEL